MTFRPDLKGRAKKGSSLVCSSSTPETALLNRD